MFTAAQCLLAELRALNLPDPVRERVIAIFRASQGAEMYFARRDLQHADRVASARHMLTNGAPTPLVRDRLVALYGISRRRAYVVIQRARSLSAEAKNGK